MTVENQQQQTLLISFQLQAGVGVTPPQWQRLGTVLFSLYGNTMQGEQTCTCFQGGASDRDL